MTKGGWWSVKFKITLDGENVRFCDLSDVTQEHITKLIADGYYCGEIVEETDEEDEDDA